MTECLQLTIYVALILRSLEALYMPPRTCPLPTNIRPYRCRVCPLDPVKRVLMCKYYRGQLRAGVPWWRDTMRWGMKKVQRARIIALSLTPS
ncbi:MAG: hypothetical protein DRJ41_02850 [Thermoprotei archaeon]|nr:MAG: hypothetical protein DRJ41_02850 [Thermoprotei archaeon]